MRFRLLLNILFIVLSFNYRAYAAGGGTNTNNLSKQIYFNDLGAVLVKGDHFTIDTCLSSRCCLVKGELKFTASNRAFFKEPNLKKDKENTIEFKFEENSVAINILEDNGNNWCDMGGNFEGEYFKDGTYQTSFKCSKNNTPLEKLICQDKMLAKADLQLNNLYYTLKSSTPSSALKQQNWLKERNNCFKKGLKGKNIIDCILNCYLQRIYVLQNLVSGLKTPQKEKHEKYNFAYFLARVKQKDNVDIIKDVLLQKYLQESLSKEELKNFEQGFTSLIDGPLLENLTQGEEIIFFHGGERGLYTICSSIAIGANNKIWLSFVDKKQNAIIVIIPKNTNKDELPSNLTKWINELELRHKEYDCKGKTIIKYLE